MNCFTLLQSSLRKKDAALPEQKPIYRDFRPGDVRHSLADISKAQRLLGFAPSHSIQAGLDLAMDWYRQNVGLKRRVFLVPILGAAQARLGGSHLSTELLDDDLT